MNFIKSTTFVYDPTLNIFENFTCLRELFLIFVFLYTCVKKAGISGAD